ncbi:NAD(P)H-binding protein [Mucilaginibacter flavus]|uniref:NAD(P)H-binding protein n=1 Tax=Mucilaginibacter flavus TaxID=931504 RepID=UPI0025B34AB8|nr:NAD(P)H-binding protein [Mucilaginibacter flavus]MDN3584200.1 NAD(P)H-binding protein [Mucilaginibacter flavus]
MAKKAVIAGSTGLIGSKLLQILLHEPFYDEVLILVRKKINVEHKKLTQLVVNFDQLDSYAQSINGHALFCCLGTTNAKTPNKAVYRHIDHDYPVQLAQFAFKNGIEQYHLVSSIGANVNSSFFYTKTKGETEADIEPIGLPVLHIYRPSMLTGNRREKRTMEKTLIAFYKFIDPLLFGSWKKYRSISDETVATAMYKQSTKNNTGTFIYESDQIKQLS